MKFPEKILIVDDDAAAVLPLATRFKAIGATTVETVISLEDAVRRATEESFGLLSVALNLVDRLPGKGEDVRRKFLAPVIFVSPKSGVGESLGLSPWEYCTPPYSDRELLMVVASSLAVQASQRRSAQLTRRLREEELLADYGRVAIRAGSDFAKLMDSMAEGIAALRGLSHEDLDTQMKTLGVLVARGERLCRQLQIDGRRTDFAARGQQSAHGPAAGAGQSGAVLIVDDDEAIRELSGCVVRQMGLPVLMAQNGEEAMQRFQHDPGKVGLVLLDLTLPHMSGTDVLAGIHSIRPTLPVVMITGHGEEAVGMEARRSLSGLLRKPFSPDALKAALQRASLGEVGMS